MTLDKDLWLDYHWYFYLDKHMNIQIMDPFCLSRNLVRLLGCGLDLEMSGVSVPTTTSWTETKLLAGRGRYFLRPSLLRSYHI